MRAFLATLPLPLGLRVGACEGPASSVSVSVSSSAHAAESTGWKKAGKGSRSQRLLARCLVYGRPPIQGRVHFDTKNGMSE